MNNQTNQKLGAQKLNAQKLVPWLALGSLLMLAFVVVAPFLVPLAWAGIFSYASWPLSERIRQYCKCRAYQHNVGGTDFVFASAMFSVVGATRAD
jgi:predicted PurR-regulated permease PerM